MYEHVTILHPLTPFCAIVPFALGGASSAVRAQCNYLGVWPYQRPIP